MPTFVWIVLWAAVVALVAFLALRERRAGRRQAPDLDRLRHEATAEADLRSTMLGPNGLGQSFWG